MDLEKLLRQWWSDFSIPLTLEDEEQIEQSYLHPEPFWEALFAYHLKSKRAPLESICGEQYDFYHDCVLRHLHAHDTAFTVVEQDDTTHWTHNQIHRHVNFHVKKWLQHDPRPGQLIVLALQPGIEFLIALLTALRFGLKICPLSPHPLLGKNRITGIVSEIKPQFVVSSEPLEIGNTPLLQIDPKGHDDHDHLPLSFPYKASATVQIALALHRQEPLTFVPLDAQTVYLHALRDGYISLNLVENSSWANPLSCPMRSEPCSTLMTLLVGARRVYIPDEVIRSNPKALKDEKIQLLGISKALQHVWSRAPVGPMRGLKACYKTPFDIDFRSWTTFVKLNNLEKVGIFNFLLDNSLGGAALLSRPSFELFDFQSKAALGVPWKLENPQKEVENFGVFIPQLSCGENSKKKMNFRLASVNQNLMMSEKIKPCRDDITFPLEELETLVNALPFVETCFLFKVLRSSSIGNFSFVLVVFVNPAQTALSEEKIAPHTSEINRHIAQKLGTGFLPDKIEFFPLLPRVVHSKMDRSWCEEQYNDSLLSKKIQMPLYQTLHTLKKLVAGDKLENVILKSL